MNGRICHIAGAGRFYDNEIERSPGDLVIAADGGYAHLAARGIAPDLVMGDFDSLDIVPEGVKTLRFGAEKDDTDMMLAVKHAYGLGFRAFRIYGGLGGRLSHTLANLQTLHYLSARGASGTLYGDAVEITAITDGATAFSADDRGLISVFAHGGEARGVSIEGMKYPLSGAALRCDFPLGVSNELMGVPARVSVEEGTLILIWEK